MRMAHVLIRHKVADFAKWKPLYDAHDATRKASGCQRAWLFRNAENPFLEEIGRSSA